MRDPAWTRKRFPAGARVTLNMTHDSDLPASAVDGPRAWVYADGDGANAVQLDDSTVTFAGGGRAYVITVPETVTENYAGTVMVVEIWLATAFEPIARGELEFYDGGGPAVT